MTNNSSLMTRKGFELSELTGSMSIVFVRANIEDVTPAVAGAFEAKMVTDVYGSPLNPEGFTVFQFKGHSWTGFIFYRACKESIPEALSKTLNTVCIYFQYEDTSVWQGYAFFEQGEIVEHYMFGPDYSDEMQEFAEEMGEEMPEQTDNGIPWDISLSNGDHQYLFRSSRRSISEADVQNTQSFMNAFFVEQNVWLPDWDYLPILRDICEAPALEKTDFERVDFIQL